MKYKLGIIGMGIMANALLDSAIREDTIKAEEVMAFDIDSTKLKASAQKGIHTAQDIQELINNTNSILLAIKPQHYTSILQENDFSNTKNIVSIMAGVKIDTLKSHLNNKSCSITRAMPNTPCKLGKGFVALCFNNIDNKSKEFIQAFFSACGDITIIEEHLFDAVTSVSGSGPAYVYMFIEAMIKGGMEGGLSYQQAKQMVTSTIIGATNLARLSQKPIGELIENVCSKGGTTIEAISYYRKNKLEDIIIQGINKCKAKSKLLSDKL